MKQTQKKTISWIGKTDYNGEQKNIQKKIVIIKNEWYEYCVQTEIRKSKKFSLNFSRFLE